MRPPQWDALPRGRLHVEQYVFDVARLVETHQALGEGFDLVSLKNEAILDGVLWDAFVFMEFQEGLGALEVTLLLDAALGLDFVEHA